MLPLPDGGLADAVAERAEAPGRSCPMHYLYSPRELARSPDVTAPTVYVVGGLYGNPVALDAVEALAAREPGPVSLVFNGDFHWFDHAPDLFAAITHRVLSHVALRGNVETELTGDDEGAGCGCAYPEWVANAVVSRSNAIERRLRETARGVQELCARMAALPMHRVVQVGAARVAVVHGDGVSLAGWGFARRALATSAGARRAADWLAAAEADVFACTHTCEPLWMRPAGADAGIVVNNGAAGMPSFRGTRHGLVTRIATTPPPAGVRALYGGPVKDAHVHAVALDYDHHTWWELFQALWPPGSPAHESYAERIRDGGTVGLGEAVMDSPRL